MEEKLTQRPSTVIKIVLFGPESTGKTTLAEALAEKYNTNWVHEFMRSYLEHKWEAKGETITRSDIRPIAEGQMEAENMQTLKADKLLFCDTNLRELKVYTNYYYDEGCPSYLSEAVENHYYHHYFLTDIDVPWTPDILRDRPNDRVEMFRIFEEELSRHSLPYTILKGTIKARMQTASQVIDTLLR